VGVAGRRTPRPGVARGGRIAARREAGRGEGATWPNRAYRDRPRPDRAPRLTARQAGPMARGDKGSGGPMPRLPPVPPVPPADP
jgi:hypothetical protein